MLSRSHLAGASLMALAIGTTSVHAAAPPIVYGGTGTGAAKVYRDVFNCYVTAADGLFATSPGNPTTVTYPTGEAPGCTTQGKVAAVFAFEPVGAVALNAFTTANPFGFGSPSSTNTVAYLNSSFGISTTPYPEIQFAGADVYLTSTEASQAESAAGEPIFQVPLFVTPITLPIGSKQNVKLKTADICNLFSGSTNTAEKIVFSEIVVRSDSAAASYVLGDWLAQNCPTNLGFNTTNGFPSLTPNWSAVASANGNHINFVAEKGSGGESSTVASTPNAIGYVTPDYVYPVVASSTAYPAYVNGQQPSVAAVKARLAAETYPTSYNAVTIGQQLNDQLVAPGGKGYQILGFSFVDTYQCYSVKLAGGLIGGPAQGKALLGGIKNFLGGSAIVNAIINDQGFVQAPTPLKTLLESAGGPIAASGGIQNSACPTK